MFSKWMVLGLLVAGGMTVVVQAQETTPRTVVQQTFDGQDQFTTYCGSCHGPGAKGDGPVGALLKRRPPDLTTFASRNGGTFNSELVYQIIDGRNPVKGHGGPDMPVWGDAFSRSQEGATPEAVKERIDAIVRWLGRVQRPVTTQ